MNKTISSLSLGLLLITCRVDAQQNIGNSVYICEGAAQAGPCQPGGDEDYSAGYSRPVAKWADRWGAYASDGRIDGIVAGLTGKREAEKAAIASCQQRGGATCKVVTTYYNQCFAMSSSKNSSAWVSAETEELALKDSMNSCNEKSENCFKYYSGCSLPERVQ